MARKKSGHDALHDAGNPNAAPAAPANGVSELAGKDAGVGIEGLMWPADKIEQRTLDQLVPYARNARSHSEEQVAQLAASIKEWGWTIPVLIDEDNMIIAGHGRVLAAQLLGILAIPVMIARGWSEQQKRAYVLADNKLALNAGWDEELLRVELSDLMEMNFSVNMTGFSDDELTALLTPSETEAAAADGEDGPAAEKLDTLRFGKHRIPIKPAEAAKLEALIERYGDEYGLLTGFVRWLATGEHVGAAPAE